MTMNRETYNQLIDEDIVALNAAMRPESLERQHIERVLKWSVFAQYGWLPDASVSEGPRQAKVSLPEKPE